MLILVLIKGVPAKTTRVVTIGGVLKREEMDIVMNPHDAKAIEAADYLKRRIGGKIVAISMGPDIKLVPIMSTLHGMQLEGVDENYLLSDRRMAGADTWATAYALGLGVRKVLDIHQDALDRLTGALEDGRDKESVATLARELYEKNLLPNRVFSTLPSVKDSIMTRFLSGSLDREDAIAELREIRRAMGLFVILAGIKTTDGETGSVGPQTAEALSQEMGIQIPHVTYVSHFDYCPESAEITLGRRIGRSVQELLVKPPALLTISTEYRPSNVPASAKREVRANNFKGKITQVTKWDGGTVGADPQKLGLAGSPTIVGPGLEIGRPPVQKILGTSEVFKEKVNSLVLNGKTFGPFEKGELVKDLPEELIGRLRSEGKIGTMGYRDLTYDLFGNGEARAY